jgi:hypothetical protein
MKFSVIIINTRSKLQLIYSKRLFLVLEMEIHTSKVTMQYKHIMHALSMECELALITANGGFIYIYLKVTGSSLVFDIFVDCTQNFVPGPLKPCTSTIYRTLEY